MLIVRNLNLISFQSWTYLNQGVLFKFSDDLPRPFDMGVPAGRPHVRRFQILGPCLTISIIPQTASN